MAKRKTKKTKGLLENLITNNLGGKTIGESLEKYMEEYFNDKMEEYVDSLNKNKIVKILTGGRGISESIIDKAFGRSDSTETAVPKTKVDAPGNLLQPEQELPAKEKKSKKDPLYTKVGPNRLLPPRRGDSAADVITKLYNLIKKSHDDRVKERELLKDFQNEKKEEDERKHKEFIKALLEAKGIRGRGEEEKVDEEKEKEKSLSMLDLALEALEIKGGLSVLKSIGKFFLSPLGLALLAYTGLSLAVLKKLIDDVNPEKTNQGMLDAYDTGSMGSKIMEASSDAVEHRKSQLVREAHKTGRITGADYSGAQAKGYLEDIGFIEKGEGAGTTAKERMAGANALSEEGVAVKRTAATDSVSPRPISGKAGELEGMQKEWDEKYKGKYNPTTGDSLTTPKDVPVKVEDVKPADVSADLMPPPKPVNEELNNVQKQHLEAQLKEKYGDNVPKVIVDNKTVNAGGGTETTVNAPNPIRTEELTLQWVTGNTIRTVK